MSTSNPATAGSSASTSAATSSQPGSTSATLYLFTFLATVVVLVLLSASLVFRSYTLRRRYRQGFQQALADGLIADFDHSVFNGDHFGVYHRSARRMGPKPVLWDTWIRPAEKDPAWSSITPVAVHCTPPLSPSTLMLSRQPSTAPPGSPRSRQAQPWPPFFSQLRLPNRISPTAAPSLPPPRQSHTPVGSPAIASVRSLPDVSGPPDSSAHTEQDSATLAVCVLVAMPDVSAPVYHLASDIKGKGVDPLESQARQQSVPAGPSLSSSPHRSDPGLGVDEEGLPLLEFGVVEKRTGDWEWGHE